MNLKEIEYREKVSDYGSLAGLYRAVKLGKRTADEIRTAFENSKYVVAAFHEGELVGAGRAFGDEIDCAIICDLAVYPEFQGKGIGSALMNALLKRVKHHQRIILYASPGKEIYYRKFGFKKMKTAMVTSFLLDEAFARQIGFIE